MDSDEHDIINYLKTWGKDYVSVKEITRRAAGKKRFGENPDWAKAILQGMFGRGMLERDVAGRYRLKAKAKRGGSGRWISPHIAELLKKKGLAVDEHSAREMSIEEDIEQH